MTRHLAPIHAVPLDVADPRPRGLDPTGPRHTPPDEPGHKDTLLRLALWLADVATEAAVAAAAAPAAAARRTGRADESPIAEPAP
jgi:hypothetical protein